MLSLTSKSQSNQVENLLPIALPSGAALRPAANLAAIFDDCHNYIYTNEGVLKDKIFHEMAKLLVIKLYDEQHNLGVRLQFSLTSSKYFYWPVGLNLCLVRVF